MKQKILVIIALIISVLTLSFTSLKAQDDNIRYYWFTVIIKIKQELGNLKYQIVGSSSQIYSGTLKDFDKAIWEGLRRRRIVVGAFLSKQDALNAKMLYKSKKEKIKKKPVINGTVYWFAIHFEEQPRLRIYIIRRKPGAVRYGSGDLNYFIDAFYQQLQYGMFTIGPFHSQETAEMMKNIYRRNE